MKNRQTDTPIFSRKEMKRYLSRDRTVSREYHYRKVYDPSLVLKSIRNNDTFLDIGCGTAGWDAELARKNRVYVIGIDIDRKALRKTKAETKTDSLGRIEMVVADANFLPLRKNSVDVILFKASLHHLPYTWKEVLKECYHLLKKDGRLILQEPSINPMYNIGTRILRSRLGLILTGSKEKQRLARYDEGETAFEPNTLARTLEQMGFKVETEHFRDFVTIPLKQAVSKSREPIKSVFKLTMYLTKPLDYIAERTPIIQKHCSFITVVCKK